MAMSILRILEKTSGLGYAAVVLAGAWLGLRVGPFGHGLLDLLAGVMGGIILASILFGLAVSLLRTYRDTTLAWLARRYGSRDAERMVRQAEKAARLDFSSTGILKYGVLAYLAVFFAYMFLPLMFMVVAAFNTVKVPPTAIPFKGFTLHWFGDLMGNEPLWSAALNSIVIGVFVVLLSLALGLAGALLITRLHSRLRTPLYSLLVSPLLMPGIILGISSLVFWSNLGIGGGLFVAILAQTTFIAAYCMLMFIARLQRFDPLLEEAALDLGGSHRQVFWWITIPFLRPSLITAGIIAFLQSFENFNTTVFAIGTETTLTIKLASLARKTPTPEVAALAAIFIVMTIAVAVVYEIKRRSEKAAEEMRAERARQADARIAEGGLAGDFASPAPVAAPAGASASAGAYQGR